ncbi:unnamed protein product, partial [Linum tenue]
MKEVRQPPNHEFMILPYFHKFPHHKLVTLLPDSWQRKGTNALFYR